MVISGFRWRGAARGDDSSESVCSASEAYPRRDDVRENVKGVTLPEPGKVSLRPLPAFCTRSAPVIANRVSRGFPPLAKKI
jgi:hypothetical protein